MAIWSVPDDGRGMRHYIKKIAQDGKVRVTYSPLRPTWFVLSGFRNNQIFYTKVVRACGRFHHVALEYPAQQKREYDALVTRISHSLRGRC
jgi:hypothetical protein